MKKRENKKALLQAQEKMYLYLTSLASDQSFLARVTEIRERYGIPEGGFESDLKDEFEFINSLPKGNEADFQKEIYDLAESFNASLAWLTNIRDYVLYNDFFFTKVSPLVEMVDVLGLTDEIVEMDVDLYEEYEVDENAVVRRVLNNLTNSYPLAIFVSPYATGRDIIDFIKKNKTSIETLQNKHCDSDVRIGKVRKRKANVQERDLFICNNKHLSAKVLMSKVNEKFGTQLDYDYINKIIAKKCPRGK
ncbi:MAG: hypothetical protein OQJ98_01485 [Candidatus Pacebacteria bacterium]|nr:hypothetical protein [Candidatus Paceibacterota bacterium]